MELESVTGSKITLQKGAKIEIGRALGLDSNDPTLSRRQISLALSLLPNPKSRVQFEVIGKNPIWVYHRDRDEIRVFKRLEMGEMVDGDRVCLSGKNPVWFNVRETKEREIGCVGDLEFELDSIDVSDLDPVKEFGFLVIGQEFDHYPKHKICLPKAWDWFLEEYKKESDDDDDDEISGRKRSKSTRRRRKKGDVNNDDDEWMCESEEDKELISKPRKVQRPNYSTRSKDRGKPARDKGRNRSPAPNKIISRDEEDEEYEEDEDETLGGFILTNDGVKEEDDSNETELDDEKEEEEEDFDEDDDED